MKVSLDKLRTQMTNDEINALDVIHYEGTLHLIRTEKELRKALTAIAREKILGFDTETRPSFSKGKINPPALMQIATTEGVYLFQLSVLPFGSEMAAILENPEQMKVGVGIHEDMRELATIYQFTPQAVCDLGDIARKHKLWSLGLRSMCANFFGWRISKGPRCSNWGLTNLTHRQLVYAATDAWVGRLLFLRMRDIGLVG